MQVIYISEKKGLLSSGLPHLVYVFIIQFLHASREKQQPFN